ncbi:hypothetical protein LOZ39_006870 [Ophidiomyces ophidiicola]|nr:hypothetical protein LOZ59_006882 [Ophidiomyces ophidiicola]KAI2019830.1 hypothetical protein LOZ48_006622 [Ophidiomyces ophidiicola]KAI2028506.1 hypothetical protein LOZ47_006865 [Ophidiomyces ophidiicola]KAI2038605.1 hypothetical protein LOZ44_006828 [Ophidiomyces ophidiicola]KAI2063029.1 hypothetical protein LOZ37_006783 [Ophidiomyces ophidiicola]
MIDLAVKPPFSLGHGRQPFHFPGPLHSAVAGSLAMPSQTKPAAVAAIDSHGSRQQQPPSLTSQMPAAVPKHTKESSIAIYLQVPSSISENGGSLADFAAQITCLFWFAKSSKLKQIEERGLSSQFIPPLDPECIPSIGFTKWMTTILSTTQVSRNVVLLALMFIYRLKKFNQSVRGKRGSEFRLMTIALMMGNKFLDDNTYTNKTWGEVSGIPIQEIHVMEVEFLSNIRYNLFVTKKEWEKWHSTLRIFANYFARASRMPLDTSTQQPQIPSLQTSPSFTSMSASPIGVGRATPPTYPSTPVTPFGGSSASFSRHLPAVHPPILNSTLANERKRSYDEQADEHPPKKYAGPSTWRQPVAHPPYSVATSEPVSASYNTLPALSIPPIPQLVPTMHVPVCLPSTPSSAGLPTSSSSTSFPLSNQLPLPVSRAMPNTYTSAPTWGRQGISPPALAPVLNPAPTSALLPDLARHSTTYPANTSIISPALTAYSTQTPTRLSPTGMLDRNSPYRPVRPVNTLLYPNPSPSFPQARQFPMNMMYYQPLGKSLAERRTGVLPYYPQPEEWPENSLPPFPQLPPR